MPIIDINLLKQQQSRSLHLTQASVIVGVVAGSIVALELLVVVFLYSTVAIRSAAKETAIRETADREAKIADLDKTTSEIYPKLTLTQQAKAYQSQVDAAKAVVDNHKYFTLYLSEIAINTPAAITYTTFNSDSQGRLLVSGTANSYSDVSQLIERFKNLTFAKSVTLQDAKLDTARVGKGGAVRFTMVIELKSAEELKIKPTAAPASSAAPRSGSSPAPAASPPAQPPPGFGAPGGTP